MSELYVLNVGLHIKDVGGKNSIPGGSNQIGNRIK